MVGEECHIFAQGTDGPRSQGAPPTDLHHYSNLILLCGACHKIVDSQEATYTIDKFRAMRDEHEAWVASRLSGHEKDPEPALAVEVVENPWGDPDVLPAGISSDQLFARRLSDAFPGSRGVSEVSVPADAIERLNVVLRQPLDQWFFDKESRRRIHPFWWFRGSMCLHIEAFAQISSTHCLLDGMELRVRRVAALRRSYLSLWDCLYVEVGADEPTGVYDYGPESPRERAEHSLSGYFYSEEYALWRDRPISRADYDDGATLLDGKPRRVLGAELRERYLTPFNFIVCGNRHVINENRNDLGMKERLDGILQGKLDLHDLWRFVDQLEKPARYHSDWD